MSQLSGAVKLRIYILLVLTSHLIMEIWIVIHSYCDHSPLTNPHRRLWLCYPYKMDSACNFYDYTNHDSWMNSIGHSRTKLGERSLYDSLERFWSSLNLSDLSDLFYLGVIFKTMMEQIIYSNISHKYFYKVSVKSYSVEIVMSGSKFTNINFPKIVAHL